MRGKLSAVVGSSFWGGLIPACAGKTSACERIFETRRAHPRVCGENGFIESANEGRAGSSPRVRGKHNVCPARATREGLIPACAGKTSIVIVRSVAVRAHPRVCGENTGYRPRAGGKLGSSPRVRGKPPHYKRAKDGTGLIPACAGKTGKQLAADFATQAHPRVCGENPLIRVF